MNGTIETRDVNAANILPGDELVALFVPGATIWHRPTVQATFGPEARAVVEAKQLNVIQRDGYEVHLADGTAFTVVDYNQGAVVRW